MFIFDIRCGNRCNKNNSDYDDDDDDDDVDDDEFGTWNSDFSSLFLPCYDQVVTGQLYVVEVTVAPGKITA